jgi:hypothetical protein
MDDLAKWLLDLGHTEEQVAAMVKAMTMISKGVKP